MDSVPQDTPAAENLPEALRDLHLNNIRQDFEKQPAPKHAWRGFHSKAHGIVRATFVVNADLPATRQAGVFVPGARYEAWVRFSNGAFGKTSDLLPDVRGIAIKLMGVNLGPRLNEAETQTQDFLLMDTPSIQVEGPQQALEFDRAHLRGGLPFAAFLATHPVIGQRVLKMTAAPRTLVGRTFSSVVPFKHGDEQVVRYAVRWKEGTPTAIAPPASDVLRRTLAARLSAGPIELEFCLQPQGPVDCPTENATVPWPTALEPVATLTLHGDGFGSTEQEELGERMSFNVWHGLEAHRPIGALNIARRVIYRAVYELRTRLNGKEPIEPRPKGA